MHIYLHIHKYINIKYNKLIIYIHNIHLAISTVRTLVGLLFSMGYPVIILLIDDNKKSIKIVITVSNYCRLIKLYKICELL